MATLEIHQFPCLSDNYGVLIHDAGAGLTASIDAPNAATVISRLISSVRVACSVAKPLRAT